jgi:membrane protease YdiL (CAAX protease family)
MPAAAETLSERVDEALRIAGRLAVIVGATVGMMLILGVALKPVLPMGLPPGPTGRMILLLLLSFSLVIGHLIAVVAFDGSQWDFVDLGGSAWHPGRLLLAIAIGATTIGLVGGILYASGGLVLRAGAALPMQRYVSDVALLVLVGTLVEALAFRGYLLGLLEARWGMTAALLVSSTMAGLYHAVDRLAGPTTFFGAFALAVLLGVLRLRLKSLPAAWLTHVAVSLVQALLFHASVTGSEFATPRYRMVPDGPGWWTGGRWGFDGGLAAVACFGVVSFLCIRLIPAPKRDSDL